MEIAADKVIEEIINDIILTGKIIVIPGSRKSYGLGKIECGHN